MPHGGSWQDAGVVREAHGLSVPVYFRYEMVQDGDITSTASAVSVAPENVVLTALKEAEDGEELIVRICESAGRETEATVELHFAELDWSGRLRPFEIKTLRFDTLDKRATEIDLIERGA